MWVAETIEPLMNIGNPEKLLGKEYDEWNDKDKWMIAQVYKGDGVEFMFKKDVKKMQELEEQV